MLVLGFAPSPHPGADETGTMAIDWRLLGCTIAFVIAAITDMLDGHLARKWNVVSRFGRIIDPFADKALVIGTLVCLAGPGYTVFSGVPGEHQHPTQITGVTVILAVTVLVRELLVTSIRAVYEADGFDFSAGMFGKLKMILQSVSIPLVMLTAGLGWTKPGSDWLLVCSILLWATAGVTVLSAWPYVQRTWQTTDNVGA